MKKTALILATMAVSLMMIGCQNGPDRFPVLKGPYLGQKPPGTTPVVFAPGLISTGLYTRDMSISRDGREIYFCVSDTAATAIFETRLVDGRWTEPAIASFSGKGFLDFEPALSPDGQKLLFLSNRPPLGRPAAPGWTYQNIWMTTRTGAGWGEPQLVEEPVSTDENEFFPSPVDGGALYFTRSGKNAPARIHKSLFVGGRYEKPEILPLDVPEGGILFNAFVSPKEDFLITCALRIDPTNTDQDYYVSFKSPEGKWGRLIKLGPEINTPGDNANSAFVSPDGKYLFFSSSRKDPVIPEPGAGTTLGSLVRSKARPGSGASAIYWVEARILEALKPAERG
jgi:hypothetical protein